MDPDNQNRPRQGGGIGGRVIIALIMAAIGLFMYWNQTQVNPITNEKQHVALSPDQEIKLGLESAPEMSREMGGEMPDSDPRVQEVKWIGQKLVDNSDAKKSPWKFQFHLLADPKTINAFALPGGQVFITLGLYNKLTNEAQLAGVLGHEMGHVIERHSAQQMAKSQLGNLLVVAVGTAASDPNQGSGSSPMVIAAMVNKMIQLRYSRGDESQADLWGIRILEQVGYDPREMIKVMEVLKASGGGGNQPAIFQSHPDPELRIQQIEAELKARPPAPGLSKGRNLSEVTGLGKGNQQAMRENDEPLRRIVNYFFDPEK